MIIKLLFILRAMDEKMENAFFLFTFFGVQLIYSAVLVSGV